MMDYKNYTLLIVDDDEILRKIMIYDFKKKGFNILSADSGNQAFELVLSQKVDMVISDIRMPNGDGVELLDKIRTISPNIPKVILVTGFTNYSEAECLGKGAQKFLIKPVDRKVLMDTVVSHLSNASAD